MPLADVIGSNSFRRGSYTDIQRECLGRYSLTRALSALAGGSAPDGLEGEMHDELCRRDRIRPKGFVVPIAALSREQGNLSRRDLLATSGTGGFLVDQPILGDQLIDVLRAHSRVITLGARTLGGLTGSPLIPRLEAGTVGYWKAEAVETDESTPTIGQLALELHVCSAYTELSRELIIQSSVDVEGLVRSDMARTLGTALDLAAVQGSGTSAEPLGIVLTTGTGTVTFGGAPVWQDVIDFEKELADSDADVDGAALGFLTTPAVRAKWRATPRVSGQDSFLMEDGMAGGYRLLTTTHVPDNKVIFGNWSDVVIATWGGGIDVVVDPYSKARSRMVAITSSIYADIVVRRAVSFVVSTDSGAQ